MYGAVSSNLCTQLVLVFLVLGYVAFFADCARESFGVEVAYSVFDFRSKIRGYVEKSKIFLREPTVESVDGCSPDDDFFERANAFGKRMLGFFMLNFSRSGRLNFCRSGRWNFERSGSENLGRFGKLNLGLSENDDLILSIRLGRFSDRDLSDRALLPDFGFSGFGRSANGNDGR